MEDAELVAKMLDEAINEHLKKQSLAAGNTRYWPKEIITTAMMEDDDLTAIFYEAFGVKVINKVVVKGKSNGAVSKKTNVGRFSE